MVNFVSINQFLCVRKLFILCLRIVNIYPKSIAQSGVQSPGLVLNQIYVPSDLVRIIDCVLKSEGCGSTVFLSGTYVDRYFKYTE